MGKTYRDSFTYQFRNNGQIVKTGEYWYTSVEHYTSYKHLPKSVIRSYIQYPWYGKCPRWHNKMYHIRPRRREAKKYIHNYLYRTSKHIKLPSPTYRKPTVYYW